MRRGARQNQALITINFTEKISGFIKSVLPQEMMH
jgi:hypothetical protein